MNDKDSSQQRQAEQEALTQRLLSFNGSPWKIIGALSTEEESLALELSQRSGSHPFQPSDLTWFDKALRKMIFEGHVTPGDSYLELGSGIGAKTMVASHLGLDSVGIERLPELHDRGIALQGALEQANYLTPGRCKLLCASYLPNAYVQERVAGRTIAPILESEIERQGAPDDAFIAEQNPVDVYKRLGRPFNSFKLLHCYHWEAQAPAVFELFAKHARPDALLLSLGWRNFSDDFLESIGVHRVARELPILLYRKSAVQ